MEISIFLLRYLIKGIERGDDVRMEREDDRDSEFVYLYEFREWRKGG